MNKLKHNSINRFVNCSIVAAALMGALVLSAANAVEMPEIDGTVIHLDASDMTTIMTNDLGQVTNWTSKTSNGYSWYNDAAITNIDARMSPPMWEATGSKLGGPAIRFGYNPYEEAKKWNVLAPRKDIKTMPHRTIAMVLSLPERRQIVCNVAHIWGRDNSTPGLGTQDKDRGDGSFGTNTVWIAGGRAWIDGECVYDYANNVVTNGVGKSNQHQVMFIEAADTVGSKWACSVGASYYKYGYVYGGYLSELVAFDRVLTDEERESVTTYLQNKWFKVSWTGAGDGESWSDPENWFYGKVPGTTDTVALNGATVKVAGNITVAKIENGTLVADAIYTANVTAEFAEDVQLTYVEREKIPVTDGITAHFDASDTSTLTLSNDNSVLVWQSRSPNALKLVYSGQDDSTFISSGQVKTYSSRAPVYSATGGVNGKPTVTCVRTVSGVNKGTILVSKDKQTITQRTMFIVCKTPDGDYGCVNINAVWGKDQNAGYGLMCQLNLGLSGLFYTGNAMIKNGFAWVNGELVYDGTDENLQPLGIGNRGKYDIIAVESPSSTTFQPAFGGVRYQWGDFYKGDVSELIAFDRVLTENERKLVTAYLQDRWLGVCAEMLWTGNGDGTSWTDKDNWYPERVPTARDTVNLLKATVTVEAPAEAVEIKNGTLVAEGTAAQIRARLASDVTVQVGAGAKVAVGEYGQQAYTAELNGGELAATTNFAYRSISGCVLDLDATDITTITTNTLGQVTNWVSKTGNGVSFVQYPNSRGNHPTDPPIYLPESSIAGMPGVKFCELPDGTVTGSVLRANTAFPVQTILFVVKPSPSYAPHRGQQGLWSMGEGDHQIRVNPLNDNNWSYIVWYANNYSLANANTYVNGGVASDGTYPIKDNTMSFQSRPIQLLAVRYTKQLKSSGTYTPELGLSAFAGDNYLKGEVYEVVAYDRALTDDEFNAVQTSLLAKWKLDVHTDPGLNHALSTNAVLKVTADSTIAAVGDDQAFGTVQLDAGEAAQYPVLSVTGLGGALDLTSAALTLESDNPITSSQNVILANEATLVGPFKTVDPANAAIRYHAHSVRYGIRGLMIILK